MDPYFGKRLPGGPTNDPPAASDPVAEILAQMEAEAGLDGWDDDGPARTIDEEDEEYADALRAVLAEQRMASRRPGFEDDALALTRYARETVGINNPGDFRAWVRGVLGDAHGARLDIRSARDLLAYLLQRRA